MVIILSSHQQNTMVSTLNVLLLTLNKALPGGRPRITRVSLMVSVGVYRQACSGIPLAVRFAGRDRLL